MENAIYMLYRHNYIWIQLLFLFVPGCLISFSKSNQNYRILSITYTFIEAEYKQILIIYKIKTLSKKNKKQKHYDNI